MAEEVEEKLVRHMVDYLESKGWLCIPPETVPESDALRDWVYELVEGHPTLSTRLANAVKRSGIETVEELVRCVHDESILEVRGIGRTSLHVLKQSLASEDLLPE